MARLSPRLRWAVVIAGLDPVEGHEQAGKRRALVVSYEPFHRSGLVTVCPVTAAREPRYPQEVAVPSGEAGQTAAGVILCHQIRTISASRIMGLAGYLRDPGLRDEVRVALATHLGLDVTPSEDRASGRAVFA
jgi:mRNA-degrading endonuclease toxin of MazEF toxin-antitoxin module